MDIDEQNVNNESQQYDIFQQDKSKFKTQTKIERNKNPKETEVSKIIQSRKNENSVLHPTNMSREYDSSFKNKQQSQVKNNKK